MSALQRSKPRASLGVVVAAVQQHFPLALPPVAVVVVRGYFRDSMGKSKINDYGIYDDALFVITPFGFSGWNANSDPSRIGWNPGAGKYMARLMPGVWKFLRLKHRASRADGYMAFGQGDNPVAVERMRENGTVAQKELGCFGINLHRGGINGTSSEGCLTIPREQWEDFKSLLDDALAKTGEKSFAVVLIPGPIT